jgi:hypothetical protein
MRKIKGVCFSKLADFSLQNLGRKFSDKQLDHRCARFFTDMCGFSGPIAKLTNPTALMVNCELGKLSKQFWRFLLELDRLCVCANWESVVGST